MSIFSPHPEERRVRRVSKDQARVVASWFETAQLPPHHKDNRLRADRDLRLGVSIRLHFLQRAAVFDRHHLAEFRQPSFPVRENFGSLLLAGQLGVTRDQDVQPLDV
jgi:hypothetical protein